MTAEEDLKDLKRHQREFELKFAFAYTVFDITDNRCLGCFYINPGTKAGFDADVILWIRQDIAELGVAPHIGASHGEVDALLLKEVQAFIASEWDGKSGLCKNKMMYPGRMQSWEAMKQLMWRDEVVPRIDQDATTVISYNARACGLALAL
jgi:hypothetical protein